MADDREKAEEFNRHFMSVFTEESLGNIPIGGNIYKGDIEGELNKIIIETGEVEGLIDALHVSKAPGPDEIYSKILKECKEELLYQLT